MSARDDYPPDHSYPEMCDEIDRLRMSGRYIAARYAQARQFVADVRAVCDQYERTLDQTPLNNQETHQ